MLLKRRLNIQDSFCIPLYLYAVEGLIQVVGREGHGAQTFEENAFNFGVGHLATAVSAPPN